MYAVKAIYDGETFKPTQPIPVEGKYEVIITFLEPVNEDKKKNPSIIWEPDPNKPSILGILEGQMVVPDDFNEPLDDLKEYMY